MTTGGMIDVESLRVDPVLHAFIEQEVLPGTRVSSPEFWQGLSAIVHTLGPRNRELLITRNRMQLAMDGARGMLQRSNEATKNDPVYVEHQAREGKK